MTEDALDDLKFVLKDYPNWDLVVKNHQGEIAHVEVTFKARSDDDIRRLTQMCVRGIVSDHMKR